MPKKFCSKCGAQKMKCFDEDGVGRKERYPMRCPVCEGIGCGVCDEGDCIYIDEPKNPRLSCPSCKTEIPIHFKKVR